MALTQASAGREQQQQPVVVKLIRCYIYAMTDCFSPNLSTYYCSFAPVVGGKRGL